MTNLPAKARMKSLLDKMKPEIARALPRHCTPDRMMRVALTAYNTTPALAKCDDVSILASVVKASQLGLEFDGRQAHLVPYGSKCQLIIGYQGLMDLARRSGQVGAIYAYPVYESDRFHVEYGLKPTLEHEPNFDYEDRGELTYVYAVARLKDQEEPQFTVMSKREVDAIRSRSKASGNGPWVTDYEAMALKTVIRRLCKFLPQSVEMVEAIRVDNAADMGEAVEVPFEVDEPTSGLEMPGAAKRNGKKADKSAEPEPTPEPAQEGWTDAQQKAFERFNDGTVSPVELKQLIEVNTFEGAVDFDALEQAMESAGASA